MGKVVSFSKFLKENPKFLLQNGKKFLQKELEIKGVSISLTKTKEIKKLLGLPVWEPIIQNQVVLPGNGVKISFLTEEKKLGDSLYVIIDGTEHITTHNLPEKTEIILSSSSLAKGMFEHTVGYTGKCIYNSTEVEFIIVKIDPPHKVKWAYRLPALMEEATATPKAKKSAKVSVLA